MKLKYSFLMLLMTCITSFACENGSTEKPHTFPEGISARGGWPVGPYHPSLWPAAPKKVESAPFPFGVSARGGSTVYNIPLPVSVHAQPIPKTKLPGFGIGKKAVILGLAGAGATAYGAWKMQSKPYALKGISSETSATFMESKSSDKEA